MTEKQKVSEGILRRLLKYHDYEVHYEKSNDNVIVFLQKRYIKNKVEVCQLQHGVASFVSPIRGEKGIFRENEMVAFIHEIDFSAIGAFIQKSDEVALLGDGLIRSYFDRMKVI